MTQAFCANPRAGWRAGLLPSTPMAGLPVASSNESIMPRTRVLPFYPSWIRNRVTGVSGDLVSVIL